VLLQNSSSYSFLKIDLPRFKMFKILFLVVSFYAIFARAGWSGLVEDTSYVSIKYAIIASGKSDSYAECFVWFLRHMGATKDVTDIRNMLQPQIMMQHIENKWRSADFICSNRVPLLLLSLLVVLICVCCCCVKCCRSAPKPIIMQISTIPNPLSRPIVYKQFDKV